MNLLFKQGFEKGASVLGLAGTAFSIGALPSINKRLVGNTFEYAKNTAAGLPVDNHPGNFLAKKVLKDIEFVEGLKPGIRKSMNQFLMKEGPGLVLYAPAAGGLRLGKMLNDATTGIPLKHKQTISNLVSSNPAKAEAGILEVKKMLDTTKRLGIGAGAAVAGLTAGYLGYQYLKRRGQRGPQSFTSQNQGTFQ